MHQQIGGAVGTAVSIACDDYVFSLDAIQKLIGREIPVEWPSEDLIGRGDMLYQPSDLPRPMRLQGVFVSDAEIGRVTAHWRDQIEDPHYDLSIIESEEDGTAAQDDLLDDDADRLLPDAVDVIREYDRASASLLQRRLKIGYARAARIIDQLEARGYIGAFDGSNARPFFKTKDTWWYLQAPRFAPKGCEIVFSAAGHALSRAPSTPIASSGAKGLAHLNIPSELNLAPGRSLRSRVAANRASAGGRVTRSAPPIRCRN